MRLLRSPTARKLGALIVLGAISLAAVSISIIPALSGTITTLDGRAVFETYMAYRYKGSRFNFKRFFQMVQR